MANINVKIKEITEAKKGDILYFDGLKWVPVSLEFIFKEIDNKIANQGTDIESLKASLTYTKEQIQKELTSQKQAIAELLKGIVK
jgi:hypothetical protein